MANNNGKHISVKSSNISKPVAKLDDNVEIGNLRQQKIDF